MPDMRRADALQLFIDLSGRLGEQHPSIEEYTGFRLWNFPEVIKEALMNSDNQDMGIEDRMVEAISVLIGLPTDKITIDDAAAERQGKLLDKFALQLAAYMLAAAEEGFATSVLPHQANWGLQTADRLLKDYSREVDGAVPGRVLEVMGSFGVAESLEDSDTPKPVQDSPYWRAQRMVTEAHDRREALVKLHEEEAKKAQQRVDEAVHVLRHLKAGTPPEVLEAAEKVVRVRRPEEVQVEEGPQALKAVIQDIMAGAPRLRTEYIGTKSYEGWAGQSVSCKYGFSPKHGSVTFAVELTDVVRARLNDGGDLREAEIEAAVHYLTNLGRAQVQ